MLILLKSLIIIIGVPLMTIWFYGLYIGIKQGSCDIPPR